MLPREAFANVVRALRQGSKRSQDELAAIDQSHLSRIERGKVEVSLQMIFKIASMLEIEPTVLVLLTSSLKDGESVEAALTRAGEKLKELRKTGVIDLLSDSTASRPPGRPVHPDTRARTELALQLKHQGMSLADIAKELKVSKTTVHRYLSGVLK
ncbi:helix-turn-helix domain-containing protein [Pseudomonas fulva]|uniref:helix-turn-helix domain-containing protein n=1 Tax=Pseudomonas fulva TaxID=47880 RepID=UPI0015E3E04C|nr:helix-turn-helix domain-containing protein [Pseudomonas fulva]MBA1215840.1 transcriptional regulator [Pseudomonas fulva]